MKTASFKEQIMSKDKYPSIFSRQMEAIVVRPIARERKDLMNYNLGYLPVLAGGYSVT